MDIEKLQALQAELIRDVDSDAGPPAGVSWETRRSEVLGFLSDAALLHAENEQLRAELNRVMNAVGHIDGDQRTPSQRVGEALRAADARLKHSRDLHTAVQRRSTEQAEEIRGLKAQLAAVQKREVEAFEVVWQREYVERRGYQYGEDALEQVRFGWDIACTHLPGAYQRHSDVVKLFVGYGQEIGSSPHIPKDEVVRFRCEMVMEEAFEMLEACFTSSSYWFVMPGPGALAGLSITGLKLAVRDAIRSAEVQVDLPKLADAWCDIDVVVEGARVAFGVDGVPIWEGVQLANLAKFGGPKDPVTGKQQKPPGWAPFDVASALRAQGWSG